jgi:hypothetical protein
MPLTLTRKARVDLGAGLVMTVWDVTADSSYPSGGYSLPPARLGVRRFLAQVDSAMAYSSTAGYMMRYTGSALQFWYPQGGSSGGTNNGTGTGSIPSGTTTVTSNAAQPTVNINTAPARQVQTGADLTGVTGTLVIIGTGG